MTLFLTSSPFLYQHDPATLNPDNEFVDRLKAVLPQHARMLFVASNPKDHEGTRSFARVTRDALRRAGISVGKVTILDEKSSWWTWRLVQNCDLIVMSGGHVPTQNAFINKIPLRRHLKRFDGVLMGISAGSMNCADVVYAQPEEPGESSPEFPRFLKGLGLTDYNILPHFQEVCDRDLDGMKLYDDITAADSMGHEFLVFPDGTYIFRDHEEYAILGECWRMADGEMEKLCENGERIELE